MVWNFSLKKNCNSYLNLIYIQSLTIFLRKIINLFACCCPISVWWLNSFKNSQYSRWEDVIEQWWVSDDDAWVSSNADDIFAYANSVNTDKQHTALWILAQLWSKRRSEPEATWRGFLLAWFIFLMRPVHLAAVKMNMENYIM